MAMDIISKDKKEIQWKGLPRTSLDDIEELKVRFLFLPLTISFLSVFCCLCHYQSNLGSAFVFLSPRSVNPI